MTSLASICLLLLACVLAAPVLPALALGDGTIVAVLEDGTEMRERITLKGQSYRWMRSVEFSSQTADSEDLDWNSLDFDNAEQRAAEEIEHLFELLEKSDEELAMLFGNTMLFESEEYQEEIPDDEVAVRAKKARDDILRELSIKEGIAEPEDDSSEPRTSAGNTGVSTNITVDEQDKQGTYWETLQMGKLNKDGQNRKLLSDQDFEESTEENWNELNEKVCIDGRTVKDNKKWPHTAHVALGYAPYYTSNKLKSHHCSATLISKSTAVSAAHCFYKLDKGNWKAKYSWAPGYDSKDNDPSPFGMWKSCYSTTIKTIYTKQTNEVSWTALKYDFAVMNFHNCNGPTRNGVNPSIPGKDLSFQGFWPNPPSSALSKLHCEGYPGAQGTCGYSGKKCKTRVWGEIGPYDSKDDNFIFGTWNTASPGMSGSGTYVHWSGDGQPYVTCIIIMGSTCSGQTFATDTVCRRVRGLFEELIVETSVNF